MASAAHVIPAKAGIQAVGSAFPKARQVDSRFRGNDGLQNPARKTSFDQTTPIAKTRN
jgi:hypothetical protein